jgi:hypothetical protein
MSPPRDEKRIAELEQKLQMSLEENGELIKSFQSFQLLNDINTGFKASIKQTEETLNRYNRQIPKPDGQAGRPCN